MSDIVEIRYSKSFAYFALIIMIGIISFLAYIVLTGDPVKWKGNSLIYLSIISIILFTLTIYLIVKYFIPALNGKIAVVLNNEFIIDHIRNNVVKWDNVKEIRNITNASSTSSSSNFIAIDLINSDEVTHQTTNIFKKILYANNRFFYGTPILIPTQFIEGSNRELMNTFLSFFQQTRTACNIGLQQVGLKE